jgi:hypothetical protein
MSQKTHLVPGPSHLLEQLMPFFLHLSPLSLNPSPPCLSCPARCLPPLTGRTGTVLLFANFIVRRSTTRSLPRPQPRPRLGLCCRQSKRRILLPGRRPSLDRRKFRMLMCSHPTIGPTQSLVPQYWSLVGCRQTLLSPGACIPRLLTVRSLRKTPIVESPSRDTPAPSRQWLVSPRQECRSVSQAPHRARCCRLPEGGSSASKQR